MVRAAVYARISSDDGSALGVSRQVEDCRKLADGLGWEVAEEYIDNDVSAFSGKRRPAYERMLADLVDGFRDAVLVYHPDRLTRRPLELEKFLEVIGKAGVAQVRFAAGGSLDMGTGDGLLVLRMMAAVAANESETKSRRLRRKHEQIAAEGRPGGGSVRPFGFESDRVTVIPAEAEVVRQIVARFLAGESVLAIGRWLEEEGVRTVTGKTWRTTSVRTMLASARIAGLRAHRGEVVGPAVWEAIITPADRDRVLARMEQLKTSGRRSPRRYLLSGMLRCGKCDHRLYSSARKESRRYVCKNGPDHGGCGRLTIVAAPVEELVTAMVLYRLDTHELEAALTGKAREDVAAAELSDALAGDRAQLDELAGLYADKTIGVREWVAARKPIEGRIEETERRLGRLTRTDALAGLVGNGAQLANSWGSLNLTRQAAIIKAVVDQVTIAPGAQGATTVDPGRVQINWRL